MATNLAKNKIVFGDTPVIDLTSDNATASDVADGIRFHLADGTVGIGTAHFGTGATVSGNNISMPGTVNGWTPHNWVTCTDAELNDDIAFASRYGIKPYLYSVWSAQPGVDWGTATDAQIDRALSLYYQDLLDLLGMWNVGDERVVNLSAMSATESVNSQVAQSVTFVLTNVGGKTLATPINGHTTCAFQVDQKYVLKGVGGINSTQTNVGGWKSSAMRTWCNSTYKNAIPSTLRGIFKEFINQSGLGGGSSSGIEDTTDTFALRAEIELFGSTEYSVSGEGSQVTYYKTRENRAKNSSYCWGRSPRSKDTVQFCTIVGATLWVACEDARTRRGIAPFGVI